MAVVDSTLPDMDLVKFIHRVRKVQRGSYVISSKILVLVTPDQESMRSEALKAGANGFCLKDAPIQHLANTVRMIHTQGSDQELAIADRILNPTMTG